MKEIQHENVCKAKSSLLPYHRLLACEQTVGLLLPSQFLTQNQGDFRSKVTQHATQWGNKGWHTIGTQEMLATALRKGADEKTSGFISPNLSAISLPPPAEAMLPPMDGGKDEFFLGSGS